MGTPISPPRGIIIKNADLSIFIGRVSTYRWYQRMYRQSNLFSDYNAKATGIGCIRKNSVDLPRSETHITVVVTRRNTVMYIDAVFANCNCPFEKLIVFSLLSEPVWDCFHDKLCSFYSVLKSQTFAMKKHKRIWLRPLTNIRFCETHSDCRSPRIFVYDGQRSTVSSENKKREIYQTEKAFRLICGRRLCMSVLKKRGKFANIVLGESPCICEYVHLDDYEADETNGDRLVTRTRIVAPKFLYII